MRASFLLILLSSSLVLLTAACSQQPGDSEPESAAVVETPEFAEGFSILERKGQRVLRVSGAWKDSESDFEYLLGDSVSDPESGLLKLPLQRIVTLSASHLAFLDALGTIDRVVGFPRADYAYNPELLARIESGACVEIGDAMGVDYEKLLALQPDACLVYGITTDVLPMIRRIESMGIPCIVLGEYAETHPLGQAEWIRFVGELLDKRPVADSIFQSVLHNYRELVRENADDDLSARKQVFFGYPWQGTWHLPGGRNYMSTLSKHAGLNYPWSDTESKVNLPLDLEAVIAKAGDAEYWLFPGAYTAQAIMEADCRFCNQFRAFREGNVIHRYRRSNAAGGNDYYETGILRADLVLRDLVLATSGRESALDSLYFCGLIR